MTRPSHQGLNFEFSINIKGDVQSVTGRSQADFERFLITHMHLLMVGATMNPTSDYSVTNVTRQRALMMSEKNPPYTISVSAHWDSKEKN